MILLILVPTLVIIVAGMMGPTIPDNASDEYIKRWQEGYKIHKDPYKATSHAKKYETR